MINVYPHQESERNGGGEMRVFSSYGESRGKRPEKAAAKRVFRCDVLESLSKLASTEADLMRLEHTGRVEEGAVADLLVVDGDPLKDIDAVANSAHHRLIIKAGNRVHAAPGEHSAEVSALAAAE